MTFCQIRAPHGGRLDRWSRPTPNKGFALARGPRILQSAWVTQTNDNYDDNYNCSDNYNVNYNGDGEV